MNKLHKLVHSAKRAFKKAEPRPKPDLFETEKRRILACQTQSNDLCSALFFTMHKCASNFSTTLLIELAKQSPYKSINYEAAYWDLGNQVDQTTTPDHEFMLRHNEMLFSHFGEIYGPLRQPLDFPGREKFRNIFFLRDPRDVLVSMFYSFGYTHPEPLHHEERIRFLKTREEIVAQGIDAYVLKETEGQLLPRLLEYNRLLQSSETSLVLKYDEFATQTELFLKRVTDYLQIDLSAESVERLAQMASPLRQGDAVLEHKRSGKSGQWKDELKPETAKIMNAKFKPALDLWGF
ncbi:sulfotransferase domain-containing protein [Ruegeria meonggei]|uniref:Sulfotransferase domain protein n=1 Tax=Ruegeria meonggei TaxID=1446476 RepID=A0A1X6ZF78_9RHOB|nr:sulfotransferase domain-containing protein [Ruegeria meonggei]SLN49420.1 Sulfotransferase domain protein [Ruegeria meonggei]